MLKCGFAGKYDLRRALTAIGLMALAGAVVCSAAIAAAPKDAGPSMLSKCRADLAKRLKVKTDDIKLANMESTTWPNTALGMPEIGRAYAQVLTPGSRIILQVGNRDFIYTTSAKAFRYGGPTRAWSYSMLYLQSIPNEPNFNSDLYQCSLLGTNSARLATAVSDYYPQDKGFIIFSRRTSRSGFDLLYVQADKPGKEHKLFGAFAFGSAAFDGNQQHWASYLRPMFAGVWSVGWGRVDQPNAKPQILPLPEGTDPDQIAWSGQTLMILAKKDNGTVAYELNTASDSPAWKQIQQYSFPGYNKYMLNKSESLEIESTKVDGKPGFEVSRVWFTGDRNPVAKIADFTMQGFDLVGPYAFVWGEKSSHRAAYSVDISSGDSVVGFVGTGSNIKPFAYPPRTSPLPKAPRMD